MRCSECEEKGRTHTVRDLGSSSTLLGSQRFYDEQDKFHIHDLNTITTVYRCSNGHVFKIEEKKKCPTCGDDWSF